MNNDCTVKYMYVYWNCRHSHSHNIIIEMCDITTLNTTISTLTSEYIARLNTYSMSFIVMDTALLQLAIPQCYFNLIYIAPSTEQQQQHLIINSLRFALETHPNVPVGYIAMNQQQRQWCKLTIEQQIHADIVL